MFKLIKEDGSIVVLETKRGRFVLSESFDSHYPGFYVDYQEPGKPERNLALIEHGLEEDVLRSFLWEGSDSECGDYSHCVVHERPESDELTALKEGIRRAQEIYEGIDLELHHLYEDGVHRYELGYVGSKDYYFYPIQEFHFTSTAPSDAEYCALKHGITYIED